MNITVKGDIEIIAQGSFEDQGYKVNTAVIRVQGKLMKKWLECNRQPDCLMYAGDPEGLQKALDIRQANLTAWEHEVQELMGISGQPDVFAKDGFSFGVWRNTSEIFTVVHITPKCESEQKKTIDEIIKEYPSNVPVPVAAELLGKGQMYIRTGLQNGRLPFGSAVKLSSQWSYHIPPLALKAYIDGDRVMTTPSIIEMVVRHTLAAQEEAAKV